MSKLIVILVYIELYMVLEINELDLRELIWIIFKFLNYIVEK